MKSNTTTEPQQEIIPANLAKRPISLSHQVIEETNNNPHYQTAQEYIDCLRPSESLLEIPGKSTPVQYIEAKIHPDGKHIDMILCDGETGTLFLYECDKTTRPPVMTEITYEGSCEQFEDNHNLSEKRRGLKQTTNLKLMQLVSESAAKPKVTFGTYTPEEIHEMKLIKQQIGIIGSYCEQLGELIRQKYNRNN